MAGRRPLVLACSLWLRLSAVPTASFSARAATRRASPQPDPATPAAAFLAAWHAGDYAAMYALIAPRRPGIALIPRRSHGPRTRPTATMAGLRACTAGRCARRRRRGDRAGVGRDAVFGRSSTDAAGARSCGGGRPPGRLDARADVPGLAPGRDAREQGARCPGAPRPDPRPRRDRARARARRRPHLSRRARVRARHRVHAAPRRARRSRAAPKAGWPAATDVRPGRARGVARRPWPARPACGWSRRRRPPRRAGRILARKPGASRRTS